MSRPQVYLDVSIGGRPPGRMTFELLSDIVPRTAAAFRALCVGDRTSTATGVKLTLRSSIFHRVIAGFMAQGGDITRGDGTGGESIYGLRFEDENFRVRHSTGGLLSMANSGPNTNGSQFFITFAATPHLDGKHVVFGKIVDGMHVLKAIERVATGANDRPRQPVTIVACGELEVEGAGAGAGAESGAAATSSSSSSSNASSSADARELMAPVHTTKELMAGEDRRKLASVFTKEGLPANFGKAKTTYKSMTVAEAAAIIANPNASSSASSSEAGGSAGARKENAAVESALEAVIRDNLKAKKELEKSKESQEGGGARVVNSVFGKLAVGGGRKEQGSGRPGASSSFGHDGVDSSSSDEEDDEEEEKEQKETRGAAEEEEHITPSSSSSAASSTGDAVRDRLFALRMKMAAGRKENHKEVVMEHKRLTDPQAEKRERWAAEASAKAAAARRAAGHAAIAGEEEDEAAAAAGGAGGASKRAREDGDGAGAGAGAASSSSPPASYLSESASHAEWKVSAAAEKKEKMLLSYGVNALSNEAEARAHERRIAITMSSSASSRGGGGGGGGGGGASSSSHDIVARLAPGASLLGGDSGAAGMAALAYGQSSDVDAAGAERVAAELTDAEARRAKKNRRRRVREDASRSTVYINEDNRKYVERLAKHLDPFTVEIKQSLERGTAV